MILKEKEILPIVEAIVVAAGMNKLGVAECIDKRTKEKFTGLVLIHNPEKSEEPIELTLLALLVGRNRMEDYEGSGDPLPLYFQIREMAVQSGGN